MRRRPASDSQIYETADGHNHWHLRAAMRYSLYDAAKTVEVAPSQKVGFCLADSAHTDAFGPSRERVQPIGRQGRSRVLRAGQPEPPPR